MSDKTKWIKPEANKPVETEVKPAESKKQSTREKMYGKQK